MAVSTRFIPNKLQFLHLPLELQDKILNYLSFEQIAQLRLVCKTFDKMCQSLLNNGFKGVDKFHGKCLKKVKSQLPRRESERRNHPLARHCDILNAIETRLSLLNMTFMKYVDLHLCCFIPGKVIDEIYRVLLLVRDEPTPPRAHEILQELRDISSMAMEHFDDKIVPILKQKIITSSNPISTSRTSSFQGYIGMPSGNQSSNPYQTRNPYQRATNVNNEIVQLRQSCNSNLNLLKAFRRELNASKSKVQENAKKILEQEKTIMELNHTIADQNTKITEQDGRIYELNRKLHGLDVKLPPVFTGMVDGKEVVSSLESHQRIHEVPNAEDAPEVSVDSQYRKRLRSSNNKADALQHAEVTFSKRRKISEANLEIPSSN